MATRGVCGISSNHLVHGVCLLSTVLYVYASGKHVSAIFQATHSRILLVFPCKEKSNT